MDELIKIHRNRFNGRVITVQLRVPWEAMYPVFNGTGIRAATEDLQ